MTRLNLVLLVAVMVSALYLVRTQYESRRLFTALDRATAQAHRLDVELDRLQVERRAQATPLRVEKLAKEQLQMRTATPAITQYISASTGALIPMPAMPVASAPAPTGARR
jgi:cell division protein FtsL